MTEQEKSTLYNVILQLIDCDETLTKPERRDLMNQLIYARCHMNIDEILDQTQNNRKLRVKRGTTAQNDEYVGLAGELTMDTDENTLRIHDGQTPGGHVVGANQTPTIIQMVAIPDYDNVIDITDKTYTATEACFVMCDAWNSSIYVNDVRIAYGASTVNAQILLNTGDEIRGYSTPLHVFPLLKCEI